MEDLYPQLLNKVNLFDARLINRSILNSNAEEFDLIKRKTIINYIYGLNFDIILNYARNDNGSLIDESLDDFLDHQKMMIDTLSSEFIDYLLIIMNMIKSGYFNILQSNYYNEAIIGFYFYKGRITFFTLM